MGKGTFALAIDAFTSALMKMEPGDEKRLSLKYDLAEAYEKDGNNTEALQMYTDVMKWNPTFREVSEKVDALGGASSTPPTSPTPSEMPSDKAEPAKKTKPKAGKNRVSYI